MFFYITISRYGKYSFQVAAPKVAGIVTALVIIAPEGDEIDVEILGGDPHHWQVSRLYIHVSLSQLGSNFRLIHFSLTSLFLIQPTRNLCMACFQAATATNHHQNVLVRHHLIPLTRIMSTLSIGILRESSGEWMGPTFELYAKVTWTS